jgi:adenosylhomocysteine nucleosidase
MRILVTFAVEAEFAPWLALRKFRKRVLLPEVSGGLPVFEAQRGGNTLWVFLTGMGPGFPGLFQLGMLATKAGVEIAISSGLAGSLRKEHKVGELLAPRHITGLHDVAGFSANPDLLRLSKEHGAKIVDTLLSADRIVGSGQEKSRLAHFADAVDMESHRIMQEFAAAGLPAATVRAISDESDEDLPIDFAQCLTADGKVKALPLLRQLLRSPAKLPGLVRFGGRSKKAAAALAEFLDSFATELTPQAMKDSGVAAR